MTRNPPDYSLVVACLNEEEALPHLFPLVDALFARSRERGLSPEIVLVDDGSTDGTPEILRHRAESDACCRVVTHPENRGFGAALRTGIAASTAPVIVSYDADATYPIDDVLKLIDSLEDSDVAGATPFAAEGGAEEASAFRRFLSRGVVVLYRFAVGRRSKGITVFTCAFRAYRRDALEKAPFQSNDFLAAAEILSLLLLAGRNVVEVPSTLTARRHGVSKMKVMKTGLRHLGLCARIRLRLGRFGTGAAT